MTLIGWEGGKGIGDGLAGWSWRSRPARHRRRLTAGCVRDCRGKPGAKRGLGTESPAAMPKRPKRIPDVSGTSGKGTHSLSSKIRLINTTSNMNYSYRINKRILFNILFRIFFLIFVFLIITRYSFLFALFHVFSPFCSFCNIKRMKKKRILPRQYKV